MNIPIHPNPAMFLSPEMVQELALGMDTPYDVAATYGLSQREFDKLQAQPWFGELIAKKRMELADTGILFTAKAAMMAEELWQKLYQHATAGTLAHTVMLDVAKQLTDIGKLRPIPGQPGDTGAKFQININVGEIKENVRMVDKAIDVTPTISIPLDILPPKPEGFRVPDFKLTPDLVGNAQAVQAALAAAPA